MVPRRVLNTQDVVMVPCPNANCFAGQVSCSEGAERLGQIGKSGRARKGFASHACDGVNCVRDGAVR